MIKKLRTFDFKKFFIQRGERVGFGIALVVMMFMVAINGLSMGLWNTTATANTRLLKHLNTQASEKVTTSKPPLDMAALPHDLHAGSVDAFNPDMFACQRPFFGRETRPDRKWRQPKVLAPVEFAAQVVRGGIESYVLVMGEDHKPKLIGVLAPHDAKLDLKAALRMQGIFANYNAFNAVATQASGGAAGGSGAAGGLVSGTGTGMNGKGDGTGGGHHHKMVVAGHGTQYRHRGHSGDKGGAGESEAGESETGEGGGSETGQGGGGSGRSNIAGSPAGETEHSGPRRAEDSSVDPRPRADLLNRTILSRETDLKFISVTDFMGNPSGKRLAKTLIPMRMAIVSGSFPYRSQLEEYRRALHFDSIEAMLNDPDAIPEFLGMQVQRRTVRPNGDPITDWADLDIETPIRQLRLASTGSQKENAEFLRYGIIIYPNRLVMPRPKLSRHERYPAERLTLVKKAIAEFKKSKEVVVMSAPRKPSIFDKEIDVWSDAPVIGGEGGNAKIASESEAARATGSGSSAGSKRRARHGRFSAGEEDDTAVPRELRQAAARVPPEYCLLRFIDVTIEPGSTYEYRVKIEIANPGYNNPDRAVTEFVARDPAMVAGQWSVVTRGLKGDRTPLLVTVPDDLEYYAVDEPSAGARSDHDQVSMEVHRWLDVVQVDPADRASVMPVGGWSILPQIRVRRGEYIGRTVEMPLPVWKPTLNGFGFATAPENEQRQGALKHTIHHLGVPVDFATDPLSEIAGGPILVDFDGGKQADPKDPKTALASMPWEVLVYTADNKLVVRNSARDTGDPRRLARVNDWAQWLKATSDRGRDVNSGSHVSGQEGGRGKRRGGP
jgi:hypothetical protein